MRSRVYFIAPTKAKGWRVRTVMEHGRYHEKRPASWRGPFPRRAAADAAADQLSRPKHPLPLLPVRGSWITTRVEDCDTDHHGVERTIPRGTRGTIISYDFTAQLYDILWSNGAWTRWTADEIADDATCERPFQARTALTGGAPGFPIVDRHGTRIHVGDRLRAQVSVGRYGAVKVVEHTITEKEAHWPLCFLDVQQGLITTRYDPAAKQLECHDVFHDYEHGHETWAEIIPPAGGGQ
jgi:hypothetical protein